MYAKKKRPRLVRQSDLSKGTERSLRYYVQHLPAPSPPPGPPQASKLGNARAIIKTQVGRPRYKATGKAMLTGRFSSAVRTVREAEKLSLYDCRKVWELGHASTLCPYPSAKKLPSRPEKGNPPPSPGKKATEPVISLIASPCQLPASRPAPDVQARKRGRQR